MILRDIFDKHELLHIISNQLNVLKYKDIGDNSITLFHALKGFVRS